MHTGWHLRCGGGVTVSTVLGDIRGVFALRGRSGDATLLSEVGTGVIQTRGAACLMRESTFSKPTTMVFWPTPQDDVIA